MEPKEVEVRTPDTEVIMESDIGEAIMDMLDTKKDSLPSVAAPQKAVVGPKADVNETIKKEEPKAGVVVEEDVDLTPEVLSKPKEVVGGN